LSNYSIGKVSDLKSSKFSNFSKFEFYRKLFSFFKFSNAGPFSSGLKGNETNMKKMVVHRTRGKENWM